MIPKSVDRHLAKARPFIGTNIRSALSSEVTLHKSAKYAVMCLLESLPGFEWPFKAGVCSSFLSQKDWTVNVKGPTKSGIRSSKFGW